MPRVVRVLLRLPFQRRFLVVAALSLLATGMLAFAAGPALAGPIAPDAGSGSPNAEGIRQLYLIIFALGAVIFFGVGGLLLYTLIRFRAKKGAVAAQIHGSTRMEVSWTVGAALLLVVISVVTFAKLGQINDPPDSGPGGTPVTKSGAFVAVTGSRCSRKVSICSRISIGGATCRRPAFMVHGPKPATSLRSRTTIVRS